MRPQKGLEAVIAKICKDHSNENDELQLDDTFYRLSENDKTGIFLDSTAELLAEEILAKAQIGKTFTICIVGIHCVVSICRLILQFEHISYVTKFGFTIMDYSKKKLNDLRAMLQQSQPEMKTQVKYKPSNFLFAPNNNFQKYNIILCFLNQSITRMFSLKFILLQCYCFSNNSDGLQKVLCSQRVSVIIY